MADRPSTSTTRVGRPRTKSAHQTPCVPLGKPKVGRPRSKPAHASKVTDSSKKPKGKKTPARPPKQVKVAPIEERVIEIDSNNSEEVEFPFHPLELPDLPPMEAEQQNQVEQPNQALVEEQQPDQLPIQPLDAPTEYPIQPLDTPTEDPNQPTDGYIHKIKQVAALLDYGDLQILELFKKHCQADCIICYIILII